MWVAAVWMCLLTQPVVADPFPPRPAIVPRAAWGAKDVGPGAKEHRIRFITIHHTGMNQAPTRSLEDKLRGLQAWSQRADVLAGGRTKPAWPDVPYHFYIAVDGRVGEARDVRWVGDTNTEYDPTGHLLIVLEGNFETELPTEGQLRALRALTLWSAWRWNVSPRRIAGHMDYAKTLCPGANLYAELANLRDIVSRSAEARRGGG